MFRKFVLTAFLVLAIGLTVACSGPETTADVAPTATALTEAPTAAPTEAPTAEPTPEPTVEATEAPAQAPAAAEGEATYVVDTEASTLVWFGSKPIGISETGTVQIADGSLTFDGDQFVSGSMVIDMQTIETTSQSGGMAEQLVGHLSSDEFFGVTTYPTATLVIKSAQPTEVANQYLVTGDITIKETTQEIEFLTDVTVEEDSLTATAEIVLDRAAFDVRYGSDSFFDNLGDELISDEMELTVTLVAAR